MHWRADIPPMQSELLCCCRAALCKASAIILPLHIVYPDTHIIAGCRSYYKTDCLPNQGITPCEGTSCWAECSNCNSGKTMASDCTLLADTVCKPCDIKAGYYFTVGDVDCGLYDDLWKECGACTPPAEYKDKLNGCPQFSDHKSYNVEGNTGTCMACQPCTGDKYYVAQDPDCERCRCVTEPDRQCITVIQYFTYGKKLVPGKHTDDYNTNPTETPPTLAKCTSDVWTPDWKPPGFIQAPANKLPLRSSENDCSWERVSQCDKGYYYVTTAKGGTNCSLCPNDKGVSPGGYQTYCICPPGTALMEDLLAVTGIALIKSQGDQYCYSCTHDVTVTRNAIARAEQVACPSGRNNVSICHVDQMMSGTQCVNCPAGQKPNTLKSGCVECPQGTYYSNAECVICDGITYYCDVPGMSAPKLKTQSCSPGNMLMLNTLKYADNVCETCSPSCNGSSFMVFAAGHTASNGCRLTSSEGLEVLFYGCYGEALDDKYTKYGGYRLTFSSTIDDAQQQVTNVTVEQCPGLPPNADWVPTSHISTGPLACVFACRYGWDTSMGQALRTAVQQAISTQRQDLQAFWTALQQQPVPDPPHTVYLKQKVLWPMHDQNTGYGDSWEQQLSLGATFDSNAWKAYALANTFVYLEIAPPPSGLCLAPPAPMQTPCPLGFELPSSAPQLPLQCAALARTGGLFQANMANDSTSYYVVPDGGQVACRVPTTQINLHMWGAYTLCKACMDRSISKLLPSVEISWRGLAPWNALANWISPYGFNQIGDCSSVCLGITVPFGSSCIPCIASASNWNSICGARAFDYNKCVDGPERTVDAVCLECNGAHAAAGQLNTVAAIGQWAAQRSSGWGGAPCKYICDANFTSNMVSPLAYAATPCIPCSEVMGSFLMTASAHMETPSFFDVTRQTCGPAGGSYTPYVPSDGVEACWPRVTGVTLNKGNPLASSNNMCLGLCDPTLYFTILANDTKTSVPVPQGSIQACRLCTAEHVVGCNATLCMPGYYLNTSTARCEPCSNETCTGLRLYRTVCGQGSMADSMCAGCPQALLYNPIAQQSQYIQYQQALNVSQLDVSRRWVPFNYNRSASDSVMTSDEGCLVACVNNFVWIDLKTGRFPLKRSLMPSYACLPCASTFLRAPLVTPGTPLYSVYTYSSQTQTPAVANPQQQTAIQGMQGKAGGCYTCPPNTDTIQSSDIMCQSPPGYGKPIGVPVVVQIVSNSDLSVAGVVTIQTMKTPIIKASSQEYFQCCGQDTRCKIFTRSELDKNQNIFGPNSFYTTCTNNRTGAIYGATSRRLMGDGDSQKCYGAQFNTQRGDNTCFNCPEGPHTLCPILMVY